MPEAGILKINNLP